MEVILFRYYIMMHLIYNACGIEKSAWFYITQEDVFVRHDLQSRACSRYVMMTEGALL